MEQSLPVPDANSEQPPVTLLTLQEECEESVTEVKDMINQHDSEIRADMALSLLMLAEVRVHVPPLPAAAALAHCPPLVLLTTLVLAALAASEHVLLAS